MDFISDSSAANRAKSSPMPGARMTPPLGLRKACPSPQPKHVIGLRTACRLRQASLCPSDRWKHFLEERRHPWRRASAMTRAVSPRLLSLIKVHQSNEIKPWAI